ncbi:polymeric immunoglobulin receptor-like [Pleurodeles waltl]|uniref:polymeric immunoglobulin receptor-like n=1 Tax=Pleurodeles waltl TaxID=8319 RepID=UPI0037097F84
MIALIALVLVFSTARGQALTGPREVTGTRGGSVSVECNYEAEYRDSPKYWCRGPGWSCEKVVETSMSERKVRRDRVAIRDAPRTGTFTVVMEGLRLEDAGSYQCGIYRHVLLDVNFPVSVVVLTARGQALTGPREVTGTRGGSVSVECRYEAEYQDSPKYWCRGPGRFCETVVETSMSELEVRKDRVTIRDEPSTRTFTVVMEGLRPEDAGSYQCGIYRHVLLDVNFPVSVVVLTASGEVLTGPSEVTGTRGGSVSVECSYEAKYRDSPKYWCRGPDRFCDDVVKTSMSEREVRKDRVAIRDAPSTRTFTVVMEGLRPEDAGSYQCGIERNVFVDVQFPVSVVVLTDLSNTWTTVIPTVSGTRDAEDPSKPQSTVTPSVSGTSDAAGAEEKEGGSSFSVFNAIQVAQIVILLLIVTVTSLLCKRGTFQSRTPDSPEYVNTSMALVTGAQSPEIA